MTVEIWALLGPTGVGKTDVAVSLADRVPLEVVGLDRGQLYIGMDIGTATPSAAQQAMVPHHMLNLITPDIRWDAMTYARAARTIIEEIHARGRHPMVVGGTGFYFSALSGQLSKNLPPRDEALRESLRAKARVIGSGGLWEELCARDLATATRLHPNDLSRIIRALEIVTLTGKPMAEHTAAAPPTPWGRWRIVVLTMERERLKAAIRRRVEAMIRAGWADEVRGLLETGFGPESPGMANLGYREMIDHVRGALPLDEAAQRIVLRTWQYARRQLTWFRRVPADRWVTTGDVVDATARVWRLLTKEA
ncbi:tRNA (adenosine(37)-N6)-dimethylallyltransferase MiaA [Candidatus Fermentibacteria bacterium]|nr:tRNA (adenosine(37)-N6)-dimethylallyltransferase MiaA [Candidatus Fermentibacteria bacterium]